MHSNSLSMILRKLFLCCLGVLLAMQYGCLRGGDVPCAVATDFDPHLSAAQIRLLIGSELRYRVYGPKGTDYLEDIQVQSERAVPCVKWRQRSGGKNIRKHKYLKQDEYLALWDLCKDLDVGSRQEENDAYSNINEYYHVVMWSGEGVRRKSPISWYGISDDAPAEVKKLFRGIMELLKRPDWIEDK